MNYNESKKTVPESFACQKPNIIIKQIFKVYFTRANYKTQPNFGYKSSGRLDTGYYPRSMNNNILKLVATRLNTASTFDALEERLNLLFFIMEI
jgi:hypothetical protein